MTASKFLEDFDLLPFSDLLLETDSIAKELIRKLHMRISLYFEPKKKHEIIAEEEEGIVLMLAKLIVKIQDYGKKEKLWNDFHFAGIARNGKLLTAMKNILINASFYKEELERGIKNYAKDRIFEISNILTLFHNTRDSIILSNKKFVESVYKLKKIQMVRNIGSKYKFDNSNNYNQILIKILKIKLKNLNFKYTKNMLDELSVQDLENMLHFVSSVKKEKEKSLNHFYKGLLHQ